MGNYNFTQSLNSSAARNAVAATPNDNADLPNFAVRGLLVTVTTAGTLTVDPIDGPGNQNLGTFPVGVWQVPIQVRRVRSTGTTLAGVITALY